MIPLIVTVFEVATVLNATLVCAVKLNGLGVVSAGTVVTLNPPLTPPMVNVAAVVVAGIAEEV